MGLLKSLFGTAESESPTPQIRDTLFGDLPIPQWPPDGSTSIEFPWNAFIVARSHVAAGRLDAAAERWHEVLKHPGLEARHYLQAWHFLREQGHAPPPNVAQQVLGTLVEVGLPEGLDLLAAYYDHSARYYNHAGGGLVWENPDTSLDSLIDELLDASSDIVEMIGPWEDARPPAPPQGHARLSFLTPSGLHFGEAPLSDLAGDPMAGRVLELATNLMTALIGKEKAT